MPASIPLRCRAWTVLKGPEARGRCTPCSSGRPAMALASIARWGRERVRWFMLLVLAEDVEKPAGAGFFGEEAESGAGQPTNRCCVMLVMPLGSPSVTVVVLALGSACRKPLLSWPVALM